MKNPKLGQTPLAALADTRSFTAEDLAFGTSATLRLRPETVAMLAEDWSVTTVEELYSLTVAIDPVRLRAVLGEGLIKTGSAPLADDLRRKLSPETLRRFEEVSKLRFAFGARLKWSESAPVKTAGLALRESAGPAVAPEVSLLNGCMPPVRNQQDRGTCVAFATCAVMEYAFCRQRGLRLDLAEQWQYWNCKQHDGEPQDPGTQPHVSFYLAARDGVCEETVWPYNPREIPGNEGHAPPSSFVQTAPRHRATRFTELPAPRDVSALRQRIANDQPVAFAIPVFNSWEQDKATRLTGNIRMPWDTPEPLGHAMVMVGYADHPDFAGGGYFIIRNSWGQDWGSQSSFGAGYGTIPYSFVEQYNYSAFVVEI